MKLSARAVLPAPLADADLWHVVQAGASYKGTALHIFDYVNGKLVLAANARAIVAAGLGNPLANSPFGLVICAVKNLNVTTVGIGTDIGTIAIPAGITRWIEIGLLSAAPTGIGGKVIVTESAVGVMTGAAIDIYTGPGATGVRLTTSTATPSSGVNGTVGMTTSISSFVGQTINTLYVRQTGNSANNGVISVYIVIRPIP